MPNVERVPDLPAAADYLRGVTMATEQLDNIGGPQGGLRRYLGGYPQGTSGVSLVARFAGRLSEVINPRDRTSGEFIDDEKAANMAVSLGAVAGMLIAIESHSPFSFTPNGLFRYIPSNRLPDGMTDRDEIHDQADKIINLAAQVTAGVDDYTEGAYDRLADAATPLDLPSGRRYFDTGVGVVLLGAIGYHTAALDHQKTRDLEEMARALEAAHDISWDKLLD